MGDELAGPVLADVGEQRRIRLGPLRLKTGRVRPSGERRRLPRALRPSGWMWLAGGVAVILAWLSLFVWPESEQAWYDIDHRITFWLSELRTDAATTVMKALQALGEPVTIVVLRWGTILVLVAFRQWRHLLTFVVAVTLVETMVNLVNLATIRERPLAVEIIGSWSGSSHPSQPVAAVTVTLVGMRYSLLPTRMQWRSRWVVPGSMMAAVGISRLYLGVDHPSDVLFGFLLAIAIGMVTFRLMTPPAAFPVTYRRGRAAHLDIDEARHASIAGAIGTLGLEVASVEPFALEGSAGSTPLQVIVSDGAETRPLFAKLYAASHLRSDRWYKLGRTILYGYLEDEVRFHSVTRLVEYEDYMLRVMRDAGLQVAQPYGFVEIDPEREYLLLTEFVAGAQEMGNAPVTDQIIDDALLQVRMLWDARLAHRDIKPANVLVTDDEVWLIDVAFGTARPTAWRQAVDLANMMLVLALQAEPERVYRRALELFSAEDIAEAFAATKGVTMPSQLRAKLREHQTATGVDVADAFRALGPPTEPISVQRWSLRRLAIVGWVVGGGAALAALVVFNLREAGFL